MKRYGILFLLLLSTGAHPSPDAELVLARLGFAGVPPDQMDQFESIYQSLLVPILQRHDLVEHSQPGRATPDSVFSRLFAVVSLDSLRMKNKSLREDPTWQEALQVLKDTLAPTIKDGWLAPYSFANPPTRTANEAEGHSHWQYYNTRDGLPVDGVGPLLVDQAGYLWIGTNGAGISRFDGQRFSSFTTADGLADDLVGQILEDRQGHIWVTGSTAKGGSAPSRFDGQRWVRFTSKDGLADDSVRKIFEARDGALWFCTLAGLSRYDGQAWKTFTTVDGLASDVVHDITQDLEGNLWVGTEEGVSRYNGVHFTTIEGFSRSRQLLADRKGRVWSAPYLRVYNGQSVQRDLDDRLASAGVYSMLEDRAGRIWFGTTDGVSCYDGQIFTHYTSDDGLVSSVVSDLFEDREDNIWLSTRRGSSRFDGERWRTYDNRLGSPHSSIAQDQTGNVWFSTSTGLSCYKGNEWTTFTTGAMALPGLDGMVLSLLEDRQGHLWIGTQGGVSRYDGRDFVSYGGYSIWGMLKDRADNLWFGYMFGGISLFDGETWSVFNSWDNPAADYAFTLVQDRSGHIWTGNTGGQGVGHFDGQQWRNYTTADGLGDNFVLSSLVDDQDHLWFGYRGEWDDRGGASRFDGQQWQHFTSRDGLAHDRVKWILQDRRGVYWFATAEGVSRYDGQTWQNFTTADGLANNYVETILEDRRGHLWIGTQGGVSRYDGQVFQKLTQRDGLGGNSVWWILEDRNDQIWFATNGGLTRFRPPPPAPPPVVIEAVVADRRYEALDNLALDTGPSLVAFEFHARSFRTRPESMIYRYRLQGYQEAWQITHDRRVEYEDLPVGEYTFEVVAVDRDLVYSEVPAKVKLQIRPQTFTSPLRLAVTDLDDVFASFYSTYSHRALGQAEVVNQGLEPLEATLRFFLPELMRQPFEVPLTLAPQSSQQVALRPQFTPQNLNLLAPQLFKGELSLELAAFSVKANPAPQLTVYGRGALRWDDVGRAAAFITSAAPAVAAFTRPSLVAFEPEIAASGDPLKHLLQAVVLFESLKAHGVRYIADANTSYAQMRADQATVDHIQYPVEVLKSKAGDCDDLTVLYCSLLENAGIATTLVDYPGHLFLLFDTGVLVERIYQLPLDARWYVPWGKTLWIPVEITQIDQSFHKAWHLGAKQMSTIPRLELRQNLVRTAEAWQEYPAISLGFGEIVPPPERTHFEAAFERQFAALQTLIDDHIEATYLDPLKLEPDNNDLRTQLLQVYLALRHFDTAIETAMTNLLDKRGDEASTYNNLGIAYFLKGEFTQAAFHFEQAIKQRPEDKGIQKNRQQALRALGRPSPSISAPSAEAAADDSKGAERDLNLNSFYWVK